ncbi:MAG: CRISPR-associated endonuclease Cas2 [Candidatus Ryanbacteria bacterium RIFCSPHIGHO2_02_FULL_48_12]|uniref:CRISPR-associated endoribonuclease Cas2 n=1 Tax=Candidatus Ryanbacteria bacterium RIFCSPHIGHO2_01_FULL_48_27 TaxID=1802115 RepID=A0A1G2G5Z9_9BACT|nr:MAG: CRISPR-associated endonuclease Cas2 [Candidatus Ryanbacteria bacterium RIFCSPHIGHO2_01_FULL_48_27]OGZ50175.1 MAG: CRISPR-associated endonuclease Cas2 [Candidatus Ryanbacteria bacterium RIFCSPHIGHO2_02_FULL_48_12]
MLILSYDFSDDRVRARFSKFIKQYGRSIQYSVYEIRNSPRILQNIKSEVELSYKPRFKGSDSVLIFQICEGDKKKIARYGYAANEEKDVVVFE